MNPLERMAVAGIVLLVSGCAVPSRSVDLSQKPPPERRVDGTEVPASLAIGFDDLSKEGVWGVGDRVVMSVRFDDHGEYDVWFVTIEIVARDREGEVTLGGVPGAQEIGEIWFDGMGRARYYRGDAELEIGVYVRDGQLMASSRVHMRLLARVDQENADSGLPLGVEEIFGIVINTPTLRDILMDVARVPSPWSILTHAGVTVTASVAVAKTRKTREMDTPFGLQPCRWMGIGLDANGEPALDCEVLFTWKRSPLLLCAGAIEIQAQHPDDAERRLTIQLVGARRGSGAERSR